MEAISTEFAGGALENVSEMIVRKIADEASLVSNFTEDFEWVQKKLTHVRGYLQAADTQSTHNDSAKQWIQDVRDIAFQAEDIVVRDEVESLYRTRSESSWSSPRELIFRYKMGRRIRKIKGRISTIVEDAQQMKLLYDVSSLQQRPASTSTSQTEAWRKSRLIERDSRPVAIDDKIEYIRSLLADASVSVIAVVGMGGVGKTFLLQHVYNRAKSMFQNSIWLSISQSYSVQKLQSEIASHIDLKDVVEGRFGEGRAAELIHNRLQGTKSLIVLDDVWRATQQDDLITRLGLPVGNNSECKVIVTTRSREVCRSMNAHFYQMECLSEEYSWRLFCAYAFSDAGQNTPPPHLEEIALQIAKECARLPLALKTVGSSMAGIKMLTDWEARFRQLQRAIEGNLNDPIMQIIRLSYDRLSTSLKPCFAYFSFFPEDEKIHFEYLVYLWMAEGFIPHVDVGWDYLRQFANLCLVEAWAEPVSLEKMCKLHDLVLDLAVSISKENRCVFTIEETLRRHSGCLRVLLGKQGLRDDSIADGNFSRLPFVRTLSLFKNYSLDNIPAKLSSQLRVLRVLDLSNTALSSLPKSVENLKLVRVLNLNGTNIEQVPKCVAKLKSLRFLDVSLCNRLVEIPAWIGELRCLQHLNILNFPYSVADHIPPKGISKLLSLQTLRSVCLGLSIEENEKNELLRQNEKNELLRLEDLANLTELRELSIMVSHQVQRRMLEEGTLKHLVHMRILRISNELETANEAEQMPFPETMKVMKDLERLWLRRFSLPSWLHGFANLRSLSLVDCECSDYSALSLETMPNLTRLWLEGNKRCRELPKAFGKSGAFPDLRCFVLRSFTELEELWDELEDGAMASLKKLRIDNCPKIKNVPQGLERLKSLEELRVSDSGTEEVRERLREGGEEWRKIKANNLHLNFYFES